MTNHGPDGASDVVISETIDISDVGVSIDAFAYETGSISDLMIGAADIQSV